VIEKSLTSHFQKSHFSLKEKEAEIESLQEEVSLCRKNSRKMVEEFAVKKDRSAEKDEIIKKLKDSLQDKESATLNLLDKLRTFERVTRE
jgi:chromosome segregation ATPase